MIAALSKIFSNRVPSGAQSQKDQQAFGAALRQALTPLPDMHARPSLGRVPEAADVASAIRSAEAGRTEDLFGLYSEMMSCLDVMTAVSTRKLAVLGEPLNIIPASKSTEDTDAAKRIEDLIADYVNFDQLLSFLMSGHLYPVAMAEKVFEPVNKGGQRYRLKEVRPVKHGQLDWSIKGDLRIALVDQDTRHRSGHWLDNPQPAQFIFHRGHLLDSDDYWGGPLRSVLFWWLLSECSVDWWARFLERLGAPFPVGKFDPDDDEGRSILMQAFQSSIRLGGLVISKDTDVQLMQAASDKSGAAFGGFQALCREQMTRGILGQSLSTGSAQAQGLGGSQSTVQNEVRGDYKQFDGRIIGKTLSLQLFRQFLAINGWPGRAPSVNFGVEEDAQLNLAELLPAAFQAGLRLTSEAVEGLGSLTGLQFERVPTEGTAALSSRLYREPLTDLARRVRSTTGPDKLRDALSFPEPSVALEEALFGATVQGLRWY